MKFFHSKNLTIENSMASDIYFLEKNMRFKDIEEIWATAHETPRESLINGFRVSHPCLTCKDDDTPIAMFGVNPYSDGSGIVWLLGSEAIKRNYRNFLKLSILVIEHFLNMYPKLFNYVDARQKESIRWLKWLGAKIDDAKPYGVELLPFHYFEIKRGLNHV